jgi:hypothetical protein
MIVIESVSRNGLIKLSFNQDLILPEQIAKLYENKRILEETIQLQTPSNSTKKDGEKMITYDITRD